MIQSFREKLSGVIAIALVVIIAIPLAFIGLDSLFLSGSRISNVGDVNGIAITELELERASVSRYNQIAQAMGENFSSDLIDEEQIRQTAMNDLIVQKVFLSATSDLDLAISDQGLGNAVLANPQFQLGDEFSETLFRSYLAQLGYTSQTFMDAYRDELTVRQLSASLISSALTTEAALEKIIGITQETRSYQYIEIPVDSVFDSIEVSDEEVQEYYDQSGDEFAQAERVAVDYLTLSRDLFLGKVEASSEEVQDRFEALQASQPTQREVAHILLEESEESDVFERLDLIQQRLDASESFEDIAADLSDDIGSSANGGYLGFSSGDTFPDAFETALLGLSEGEVSNPVQTDAGFHVIKLLSVQSTPLDIEEEYAGLELEVKREKAEGLYIEALDEFSNLAYSAVDLAQMIEEMAELVELSVSTTAPFEREQGIGIATNAVVRSVSFGPIVLEDKLNSEVVELSDTSAVVVHLNEYFEAGIAPLENVAAQITSSISIDKATELLAETVDALSEEVTSGTSIEEVADREGYQWQAKVDEVRGSGGQVGSQIFALNLQTLPQVGFEVQPAGGYIIYKLESASLGSLEEISEIQQQQLKSQLSSQKSTDEFNAYTATLRDSADIDVSINIEI